VRAIADAPGIIMMLGTVDVGKTTAATRLAGAAVRAGFRTAVVDADVGQSDLGPPATIGWGFLPRPVRYMHDIAPAGLWFVGDTRPEQVYRCVVQGTVALAGRARRQGARIVVVDTTGWVEGAHAVGAKLRKIRALAPRHIVAIQRAGEVEPILARVPAPTLVHRLRPAPGVRVRARAERRAFRERRFAAYFAAAQPVLVDTRRVAFERATLFRSAWIAPSRVLAEVPPGELRHLLVGLAGRRGTIIAMATIVSVDLLRHRLSMVAPNVDAETVRSVEWGIVRVAPSGREEGRLSDMPVMVS
jgi:polynucleotide 5'-hydroxyl-kinase GRC3/NOL9